MLRKFVKTAACATALASAMAFGAAPAFAVDAAPVPTPAPAVPACFVTNAQVASGQAVLKVGSCGEAVTTVKTNLSAIGIRSAFDTYTKETAKLVDRFQWKNLLRRTGRVDAKTWKALQGIERHDGDVAKVCTKKSTKMIICADQSAKIMRIYMHGKLVKTFDARFGDPSLGRTRNGLFHVFLKDRLIISNLYHVPMPYSLCFSGGECIHKSVAFAANPSIAYQSGSHGCIGLQTDSEASWLFSRTPVGTPVWVQA